jgi:tRNA (uracil-5-)-methyltransferase
MLDLVNGFAGIDVTTTLFDICCGTGAIGICLSKIPKKVIGVEILVSAVENAKENVRLNKHLLTEDKMEFHAGKAEETLPAIVRRVQDEGGKIIGIVDPPRSGLHGDVLKALRTCKGLDRLIYVSCNAVS